jgi:hypothetical protein
LKPIAGILPALVVLFFTVKLLASRFNIPDTLFRGRFGIDDG